MRPPFRILAAVSAAVFCIGIVLAAPLLTTVDSTGVVGTYTSIVIGTDNLPVISYYDDTNDDLKVVHCGNASCSASNTITTVDSTGSVGSYTSITIGSDNLPIISYYDATNLDLKVVHCGNASCSASNTITTVDSTGSVGTYTSIVIGSDDFPVISYYDDTNDDLKVVHCGNASCSSGNTTTTVDSTGSVGSYTSITIGSDNLPIISYLDNSFARLKVVHCGNASCSSGNTITTVDSTGNFSTNATSITIGADDLPVISTVQNRNLRVIHCGNAACSADNTTTTVDSNQDYGIDNSIAIGSDGFPIVSYRNTRTFGLYSDFFVVHCGNVFCSAGNTITTVESMSTLASGHDTSIAIGSDDFPVISYGDATNGDLKVAKCDNQLCDLSGPPSSASSSGGAAARLALKRRREMIASGEIPAHHDTQAPTLGQVGIFVPVLPAPKPEEDQNPTPEESSLQEEEKSSAPPPAPVALPSISEPEPVSAFEMRTCKRVESRFAGNHRMIDRINTRLKRRFGFVCAV